MEPRIIRNFRKYAPSEDVSRTYSDWMWLVLGQHHSLPTRLLDWTFSPLVALHFATDDFREFHEDGVVWCFDIEKIIKTIPGEFRKQKIRDKSFVFSVGSLERVTGSGNKALRNFDRLQTDPPFAVFFEPPSVDGRIINQYALFSVLSDPTLAFDEWLLHCVPDAFRKINIPSKMKWEIRDKLDQANVNERVLFPGLDGLAKWLSRHYSPGRP
ncbi:MAG: FRG domain-containing protein [Magnetococcales bacterium]|nr:FRG domain-containing protein [Magnetococcales bacterium]